MYLKTIKYILIKLSRFALQIENNLTKAKKTTSKVTTEKQQYI